MCNIFKVSILILSLLLLYKVYRFNTATPSVAARVNDPNFTILGPHNVSRYEVADVYNQLIDLNNFTFKANPRPCEDYQAGVLLVIIISSSPSHYNKRAIIRNTWGRSTESTKVVFLLGESHNATISRQIETEILQCSDIVQGSFIDAYRNLTYKHVMGLKWVSHHCQMAKYVLKTDDDIVVNSHTLRHFLVRELSPWGAEGLIACKVFPHAYVYRSLSKWIVTEEEYKGEFYPPYCAGWAILYSQDVVNRLLSVAQTTPYFWIDDVHLTGTIAKKIGVSPTPVADMVLSERRADLLTLRGPEYSGMFLFGPPDLSTDRISQIWKAIPK